jgi:hypothetical protein
MFSNVKLTGTMHNKIKVISLNHPLSYCMNMSKKKKKKKKGEGGGGGLLRIRCSIKNVTYIVLKI